MIDKWCLDDDLNAIVNQVGDQWEKVSGAHIFITGGTGFIGRWLLESLRKANMVYGTDARATVLSRNPDGFCSLNQHLATHKNFSFIKGDVSNFEYPDEVFTHLIIAATDASADLNENNPRLMFDTIVEGARHCLDFAVNKQIQRVLYLSSGAIYGPQPYRISKVPENYEGSPDCTQPVNAYAEGKRAAEMLCAIYSKQFGLKISTARIFALLGPLLSLDVHFAAGNFIRDAINGKKIIINGNGLPCRSYLYVADLTTILWHLLVRGPAGVAYNVGSDQSISIKELAARIAYLIGREGYEILCKEEKGWNQGRYVPDTSRLFNELGLKATVSLDDAILRTSIWNGWKQCRF